MKHATDTTILCKFNFIISSILTSCIPIMEVK